ncbi:hypothetical protein BDY19DRAFT_211641 [Irpex rosettiformis]|uniref:Uncharacterized protein n=1 Tax=Irpex rosettiformis TaxID=378272 RepID=A0ACB8U1E3_9APHY|nr:hypothetical protein BDY19DRAFT_211641 [Irpex rosettiformis]
MVVVFQVSEYPTWQRDQSKPASDNADRKQVPSQSVSYPDHSLLLSLPPTLNSETFDSGTLSHPMATQEEDAIAKELNQQLRSIRAAPRNSEKAASLERDFVRRLIELVSCPYSSVKTLVARNLPNYVTSSEDFEEDILNAVYDLCEDLDSNIRKEGYAAITKVSTHLKKYVKRNADVLVQLLQSDEPDEVKVVELQLVKHLDMNPTVTLNVLCDQVVPTEEVLDEEEQAVRDRLRSLVIEFMRGRAKQNIIRHATAGPTDPTVALLFDRVTDFISRLSPSDSEILVKDIMLSLPGTGSGSERSKQLLLAILEATETTFQSESQNQTANLLTHTRHLMSLASYIALEKSLASPGEIVRFWCPNRISTVTAEDLDETFRLFAFDNILRAYDNIPAQNIKADAPAQVRKSLLDACIPLLSRALETRVDAQKSWSAYRGLLKASKQHAVEMGWKVPSSLVSALQTIQVQGEEDIAVAEGEEKTLLEEVQNLTLVRTGQSSILANCVQHFSLLYLNSHYLGYRKVW